MVNAPWPDQTVLINNNSYFELTWNKQCFLSFWPCVCMLSCISSVINRRRLLRLRSKALVSIWKMPMKYFSNRLLFPQLYSVQEHQSIEKHKGKIMTPDLCNIIYIPHICATQVILNNFPCQTSFLLAFFTERPRKKRKVTQSHWLYCNLVSLVSEPGKHFLI